MQSTGHLSPCDSPPSSRPPHILSLSHPILSSLQPYLWYGVVCFLLPYPAACYAHITRLGPRSCCCRLARQTRREGGRIRRGKEQACLAWSQSLLPFHLLSRLSSTRVPPLLLLSLLFVSFSIFLPPTRGSARRRALYMPAYSPAGIRHGRVNTRRILLMVMAQGRSLLIPAAATSHEGIF